MKARLVARKMPEGVIFPASEVWALDPNAPIPDGWEGLDLVVEPTFRGTHLVRAESPDLCECGERRTYHVSYRWQCLKLGCKCKEFKEAK